jgi:hypothetical protein
MQYCCRKMINKQLRRTLVKDRYGCNFFQQLLGPNCRVAFWMSQFNMTSIRSVERLSHPIHFIVSHMVQSPSVSIYWTWRSLSVMYYQSSNRLRAEVNEMAVNLLPGPAETTRAIGCTTKLIWCISSLHWFGRSAVYAVACV